MGILCQDLICDSEGYDQNGVRHFCTALQKEPLPPEQLLCITPIHQGWYILWLYPNRQPPLAGRMSQDYMHPFIAWVQDSLCQF